MIPVKSSYTPEEVIQLLCQQHIATRNQVLNLPTFLEHDHHERVAVGDVVREIQYLTFAFTRIDQSTHTYHFSE